MDDKVVPKMNGSATSGKIIVERNAHPKLGKTE